MIKITETDQPPISYGKDHDRPDSNQSPRSNLQDMQIVSAESCDGLTLRGPHKFLPVVLNSVLFVSGLLCLILGLRLLCAVCLLALSLLFLWHSGFLLHYETDISGQQPEYAPETENLRPQLQELTDMNKLLTSKNQQLLSELEKMKHPLPSHPLYDCALTSSLPIALNSFFREYINTHCNLWEKRDIHTEYYCSSPQAQTQLSMSALQIICDNIFDNMLKFSLYSESKEGNRIFYIRITNIDEDSLIIFRNTGEGIPETELTEIFLLNHQGSNHISGTGLGLAQVKAVVDDFGGQIWAKSSPENGFTLYLQLPYRQRLLSEPAEQPE